MHSPFPAVDLKRASKCEDHRWPASDGVRNRSAAFPERRERDHGRAIYTGPFVSTRATGRASLKTETHKSRPQARLSVLQFRSTARTVDASGLRGSVLPAFRRWRNFSGLLARWSFPLRFNSSQEPKRRVTQGLKSFSSALSHASKEPHGAFEWNEKLFPKSTKVLAKVT